LLQVMGLSGSSSQPKRSAASEGERPWKRLKSSSQVQGLVAFLCQEQATTPPEMLAAAKASLGMNAAALEQTANELMEVAGMAAALLEAARAETAMPVPEENCQAVPDPVPSAGLAEHRAASEAGSLTQLGVPAAQSSGDGTPSSPASQSTVAYADEEARGSGGAAAENSSLSEQARRQSVGARQAVSTEVNTARHAHETTFNGHFQSLTAQTRPLGQLAESHGDWVEGEVQRVIIFKEDRGFSVRLRDGSGSVDAKFLGTAICPQLLVLGQRVRLKGWERLSVGEAYLRFAPENQRFELCFRKDALQAQAL